MSGARSRHLESRRGIYGVRVRVPDDIRPTVGRVEVRLSLRTSDPLRARAQAALFVVRLFEVFEMVRQPSEHVTRNDVRAMIAHALVQVARSITAGGPPLMSWTTPVEATIASRVGPTVGEAIETYVKAKEPHWTRKTLASNLRKLNYLREHVGSECPLSSVSPQNIRGFRDALCRLRVGKGKCQPQSFASRQTTSVEHQIDSKTAGLLFEAVKAFFRWCKAEQGYLDINPAEDIRLALPKKPKGLKPRRPFTADELTMLFSSPLFTGCRSRSRRFETGAILVKDAKFWLPLLGYYTGARLGELVQLHLKDVGSAGAIPFLDINEEHSGKVGTSDAKHVKSEAGIRRVPLHPDLIELGFMDFVNARGLAKRQSKRLFHEVNFGSDGQASTVFSKFFGRLLDKVGLSDPALVFHSFRHGAEDAFRNSLQHQYVIDRIIGHSDDATSAGYGHGVSLQVAHDAIRSMKLEVSVPEIWRGDPASLAGTP